MASAGAYRIDLGFVNAYLVEEEGRFLLVDCGMPSHWKALQAALRSRGCVPGSSLVLLLTHADQDHSGNARRLRREWGARIAAHPLEAPALLKGKALRRTGVPRILQLLIALVSRINALVAGRPKEIDLPLEDGQSLEPLGFRARVIHLPGHTPGSVGILRADGEFLCGDMYGCRGGVPSRSPFVWDAQSYDESHRKALSLGGLAAVLPGHGGPFSASLLATIR